ncbi:MAG: hypothetical protein ACJ75B_01105 [Flavisolibacter sp.]
MRILLTISFVFFIISFVSFRKDKKWESRFVTVNKNGKLQYIPDEKGNILPDFSRVGYREGNVPLPHIAVVKTVEPSENAEEKIQSAIDEVSKRSPDPNGFRGAILLKKGSYLIPASIHIDVSGIVLRGEGMDTRLVASGKVQRSLIRVSGKGAIKEISSTRTKITDPYVPVGTHSFSVSSTDGFKTGDNIIVYRPGTEQWIKDLKMDQIEARGGTKQWQPSEYNFKFERKITKIEANKVFIDNPIVLAMEPKYGQPEIYKYNFEGRISNVGIENLYCESEYESDTAENHGWDAIHFDKIENGWVRNVTSRYFGYSCVNLDDDARNITVDSCNCLDAKSIITGGRRYSFNNTGQMNLFMNCHATEGRHDYVTGARVRGPNVFYNCTAKNTHADIGPHHRWAMGTLYDNIVTDGEINIQDRGNWGSGHGWSGVNQILWNCTAKRVAVQSPYVNGKNYCIGLQGEKYGGRLKGRPDGEWEGKDRKGLQPVSLYKAQLEERGK